LRRVVGIGTAKEEDCVLRRNRTERTYPEPTLRFSGLLRFDPDNLMNRTGKVFVVSLLRSATKRPRRCAKTRRWKLPSSQRSRLGADANGHAYSLAGSNLGRFHRSSLRRALRTVDPFIDALGTAGKYKDSGTRKASVGWCAGSNPASRTCLPIGPRNHRVEEIGSRMTRECSCTVLSEGRGGGFPRLLDYLRATNSRRPRREADWSI